MDRAAPSLTLLEAARTIARGGELEAELGALAGHVLRASAAKAAVIYLLDPQGRRLVPAAAAGIDAGRLESAEMIEVENETELAARVARDRRPVAADDERSSALMSGIGIQPRGLLGIALVAADESGREETEGVLLVAFPGEAPDPDRSEDPLFALADLCAVAIRKARLAHALVERSEWIERLASTDALTGLPNRGTFERMLELEIARANRQQAPLSVVLFDVDEMAAINEREGPSTGDDVLRRVASLLADQVRLVDTVGRLGGDEFGLIAPGGGGAVVAARVRDAAAELRTGAGTAISVHAAAVVFPEDGASSTELMSAANSALEQAGARGPGSIVTR